ncbi:MAG: GntR family transcriptional regulator [bacterium]|nr:GntR family transcriptional regulator [bacterium]
MKNSPPKVVKTTASQTEFDRITRKLRNEIYSGALIPRERLLEKAIAETFQVNRMVVRQALSQLSSEGLVMIEPYKGASVAEISLNRIYANYQIISTLEGLAASLAAGRVSSKDIATMDDILKKQINIDGRNVNDWHDLNRRFHRTFIYQCGNERLIELIKGNVRFTNYWFFILSMPGRIHESIEEHKEILSAFKKKESKTVRNLVERHIMGAGEYLMETIRGNLPTGMLID